MIRKKFSRLFNVTVFAAAFIAMASCAHKEFIGELVESIPAYKHEFEFADAKKLRDDLKKISDFKKTENQQNLVKILIAYNNLKKAGGENKITLAPYSKTRSKTIFRRKNNGRV